MVGVLREAGDEKGGLISGPGRLHGNRSLQIVCYVILECIRVKIKATLLTNLTVKIE